MIGRSVSRVAPVAVFVSVVVASVIGLGVDPTPVGAHGGAAEIEVLDQTPTGSLGTDLRVRILYVLDQHPAVPATFEVSAVGPDGAEVAPIPLVSTLEEGVYVVTLDFPTAGTWDVTYTASLPPAELTEQVAVGDVPQPTAVAGDADGDGAVDEPTLVSSEGSGVPTMLLVGVVIAGLVSVAALVLIVRAAGGRDRSSTPTRTGGSGRST